MSSSRFDHFLRWRCQLEDPVLELDLSHSGLTEQHLAGLRPQLDAALEAVRALEAGAIANPDEQRMVGHYWLRAPGRAPDATIGDAIVDTLDAVAKFASDVHAGAITSPEGVSFERAVLCGIGGSALGPMLLADVFERADIKSQPYPLT